MSDDTFPVPWKVGEHIAAVGDTGTGKTYLISKLTDLRQYVVIIRTKPDDIKFPGFRTVRKASAMDSMYDTRILLTPQYSYQLRETYGALERAWEQGGWTIVVDELWYVEKMLRLGSLTERLLTQGRSKKISVIVGMQRPAQISRFAISQCTHLFTFRVEGRDLQIIKESTTPRIVEPVEALTGHHFVYYNRAKRVVATGDATKLDRIIAGTSQKLRAGG
jgi:hypothetical protein